MLTVQEHRNYTATSAALARMLYQEHPRDASEILWGALIQAAQAKQHENGAEAHLQIKAEIRSTIASLGLSRQNMTIRISQVERTNGHLHGGFYQRHLPTPDIHRKTFDRDPDLINLLMRP